MRLLVGGQKFHHTAVCPGGEGGEKEGGREGSTVFGIRDLDLEVLVSPLQGQHREHTLTASGDASCSSSSSPPPGDQT